MTTSVLPKEGLMEIVSYLGRTETTDPASIIRKKCLEMQKRSIEGSEGSLLNMAKEKEEDFKRAVRYYMDRK